MFCHLWHSSFRGMSQFHLFTLSDIFNLIVIQSDHKASKNHPAIITGQLAWYMLLFSEKTWPGPWLKNYYWLHRCCHSFPWIQFSVLFTVHSSPSSQQVFHFSGRKIELCKHPAPVSRAYYPVRKLDGIYNTIQYKGIISSYLCYFSDNTSIITEFVHVSLSLQSLGVNL